jgi:uncharacterized protein (DUF58 family)
MFRRPTAYLLLLMLVAAFVLRMPLLALLCSLLLLAAGVAWLWNRWSVVRLGYEAVLSSERAFPDDEIELQLRVANRKPLPLAAVAVRELIPEGLTLLNDRIDRDFHGRQVINRSAGLGWYEGVSWRYRLRCDVRGAYRLGPASIETGDPFGFFHTVREEPRSTRLIIFPRLLPLADLNLAPVRPIGDLRARQLVRDPLRTVGVRDYHPDDPLKDVHWSATARVGSLQTRVYETTAERSLAIFLDLDTFAHYWEGIDPLQVERVISAAATLARHAVDEGYAIGLYVNGAPAEQERLARMPPSRSPAQLGRIMEALATLTPLSLMPVARLLRLTTGDLPWGTTILLVSSIALDPTRAALMTLRERGRSVAWLYLGEGTAPSVPGIAVRHAPPQSDWAAKR